MKKRIITILCAVLALMLLCTACSGKKNGGTKDPGKRPDTESKDDVWDNIDDYTVNSQSFLTLAGDGEYTELVSVCYDNDRYVYFAFQNASGDAIIQKYDTASNSVKSTSDVLELGSVFSSCIKNDRLYTLQTGNKLVAIDSSTFERKGGSKLMFDSTAVAYNKKFNLFVVALSDSSIALVDSEYDQVRTIPGIGTSGAAEAIACDNKYIYVLKSAANGSSIEVYDWEGNYKSTANVSDVRLDAVGMYCDDGVFYIGYNDPNGGGALYKTVIEKSK